MWPCIAALSSRDNTDWTFVSFPTEVNPRAALKFLRRAMISFALSSKWACSCGNPVSMWSAIKRKTSESVRNSDVRIVGDVTTLLLLGVIDDEFVDELADELVHELPDETDDELFDELDDGPTSLVGLSD